jgi:hypothetical protein
MSELAGALDRATDLHADVHRDPDLRLVQTGDVPLPETTVQEVEDVPTRVARLYRELLPSVYGFIRFARPSGCEAGCSLWPETR